MIETVDSERLRAVFELTHILRWEEDGGAVFEPVIPLPQAAKTNTPRSIEVAGECLLLDEKQPCYVKLENTIKGEL